MWNSPAVDLRAALVFILNVSSIFRLCIMTADYGSEPIPGLAYAIYFDIYMKHLCFLSVFIVLIVPAI